MGMKAGFSHILLEDLNELSGRILNLERLRDKSILITGANGFLASYMVHSANEFSERFNLKLKIFCLLRNLDPAKTKFKKYLDLGRTILIERDVVSPMLDLPKMDFIVHAASPASPKVYGVSPIETAMANIQGTQNLLELAAKKGNESFLFFSSGEVYGQVSPDKIPILESSYGYLDPMLVRSCYAESKRMGENFCVSYWHQKKVPAKVVRPFHTYGPGMSLDDGRVFSDFVADIVDRKNIQMKSDGRAIRPYCYMTDAIAGFWTVLLGGKNGEAYNVGNPEQETSVLDLAKKLVKIFPERSSQVIQVQRESTDNYIESPIARNCPDISKLKDLGWSPRHSIEYGFKRTVESYLEV